MATFPIAVRNQQLDIHNAQALERIARETSSVVQQHTGVTAGGDSRRLRGIPAIGRGVTGAITDSIPGANLA